MSTQKPVQGADLGNLPLTHPPEGDAPESATSAGLVSGPFTGVFFAIAGSLLAWALMAAFHPIFEVPIELAAINQPNAEQMAEIEAAESKANLYNACLVLGWTGALLAAAMALGEGWARRSGKIAIAGMLGGGLAGAVFGGLAGWAGHSVYQYARVPDEVSIDLSGTVAVQMTMLAVLGAGVGLVLAVLAREGLGLVTRLLAGALAGVLAGLVWPFALANLLPAAHTERIVPSEEMTSLLWLAMTAVLLGLIIPGMKLRRERTGPPASTKPAEETSTAPTQEASTETQDAT